MVRTSLDRSTRNLRTYPEITLTGKSLTFEPLNPEPGTVTLPQMKAGLQSFFKSQAFILKDLLTNNL
jgi:hypothetical protein